MNLTPRGRIEEDLKEYSKDHLISIERIRLYIITKYIHYFLSVILFAFSISSYWLRFDFIPEKMYSYSGRMAIASLLFSLFLSNTSSEYKSTSKYTLDNWKERKGVGSLIYFIVGIVILISITNSLTPANPLKDFILSILLTSLILYYLILLTIVKKKELFINLKVTRIATFLKLAMAYSTIAFHSFIVYTEINKEDLINAILYEPSLINYFSIIWICIIFPLLHMDIMYNLGDEKLDTAQKQILSFCSTVNIIDKLKNIEATEQSKNDARELFNRIVNEQDPTKAKELFKYLSINYGTSGPNSLTWIYSLLGFFIMVVLGGLIEEWTVEPINGWILDIIKKILLITSKY